MYIFLCETDLSLSSNLLYHSSQLSRYSKDIGPRTLGEHMCERFSCRWRGCESSTRPGVFFTDSYRHDHEKSCKHRPVALPQPQAQQNNAIAPTAGVPTLQEQIIADTRGRFRAFNRRLEKQYGNKNVREDSEEEGWHAVARLEERRGNLKVKPKDNLRDAKDDPHEAKHLLEPGWESLCNLSPEPEEPVNKEEGDAKRKEGNVKRGNPDVGMEDSDVEMADAPPV